MHNLVRACPRSLSRPSPPSAPRILPLAGAHSLQTCLQKRPKTTEDCHVSSSPRCSSLPRILNLIFTSFPPSPPLPPQLLSCSNWQPLSPASLLAAPEPPSRPSRPSRLSVGDGALRRERSWKRPHFRKASVYARERDEAPLLLKPRRLSSLESFRIVPCSHRRVQQTYYYYYSLSLARSLSRARALSLMYMYMCICICICIWICICTCMCMYMCICKCSVFV